MGGVFIKIVTLKLWCIILVFFVFILGALGADLQCQESQIRSFMQNADGDGPASSTYVFLKDIQRIFVQFADMFKKTP